MKRMLFTLPFLMAALPVSAADLVFEEPPPVAEEMPIASSGWTGLYLGVQAGYAFGGNTGIFTMDRNGDGVFGDYLPAFDPTVTPLAGGFDGDFDDSFIGGAHIGYDWQFGNIVLGGLVDINVADIGDTQSGFSGTPAFYTVERDLDFLVTARPRLGYAFSDRFMGYATGGLAYGDVRSRFVTNTPATTSFTSLSDSEFGYTIGGGLEAKISSNVSLGFEYLYTNLGDNNVLVNLSGPAAFSGPGSAGFTQGKGSDDDFDFHTITVKLSYRF